MRWVLLAILLVPSAGAASQVHLTYTGDAYAVTYRGAESLVTTPNASIGATDVGGGWQRAALPLGEGLTTYSIGGSRYITAPPPAPHETTRIVFVADMGTTANTSRTARAIANASPDLVLLGGDLSYAHGEVGAWDRWFDLMEPIASRVPVMPAFGNHEHYCTKNGTSVVRCDEENARWDQHFALPNGEKRYYAFDWGPLRVTALDTEAYVDAENERVTDPDAQEAFLRSSLADDRDRWDLVMFHRPIRTSLDRHGAALPAEDAMRLEGLLAPADLVLQAHVHAYERFRPGTHGTVYATSGGGGRELYDTWEPQPSWIASRSSVHHFMILDVSPDRIAARTVDLDNNTIDSFELQRDVPASLLPPPPQVTTPTPVTRVATPTPPRATPSNATTPAPTNATNGSSVDPTESNGVPIGVPLAPWMAPLAMALALAFSLRAWRRGTR